jgi:DNA-directed RNA polymerase subunit RPC12/RpoP
MGLVHLDCPSCGGALSLAEGERIVACRYCRSLSLVEVPNAVPRHVVQRAVDSAAADRVARASLQRPDVARAARGTRFDSASLCYVPFYEATAVRLGTVFVRDRVKPPAPLGESEQTSPALEQWLQDPGEEREDTKVVEQDVLRIGAACALPELGVERIRLADQRRGGATVLLQPFDPVTLHRRGTVFAPTTPAERFLQETTWRVQSQNDATRYVETRLKLLYYPVWQIRYRHRGRLYSLAVDGVTGQLLRGTAPQAQALAAGTASVGAGLSALGLGRWLRGLTARGGEGPAVLLLTIAGAVLLWLAWHWFAQEGEVELVSA